MAFKKYDETQLAYRTIHSISVLILAVLQTMAMVSTEWVVQDNQAEAQLAVDDVTLGDLKRIALGLFRFCITGVSTGQEECRNYGNFFDDVPHEFWGLAGFFLLLSAAMAWFVFLSTLLCNVRVHMFSRHVLLASGTSLNSHSRL